MKAEEIAKRRAWATTHFNDKDLTETELECAVYIPSDNFSDGWNKGVEWASAKQWINVNDTMPEPDEDVLAHIPASFIGPGYNEVAYWDGEDWYTLDGDLVSPTHWCRIPKFLTKN